MRWVSTTISSDDPALLATAPEHVTRLRRPPELATVDTPINKVMLHAADFLDLDDSDILVTLYPTYIDRTWEDVQKAISYLRKYDAEHLLCAKPMLGKVYLAFKWTRENHGEPVVQHDYYRRQDYPSCFEVSHLVIATRVRYLSKLPPRLYTPDTIYYPLARDTIDVDSIDDFVRWAKTCE